MFPFMNCMRKIRNEILEGDASDWKEKRRVRICRGFINLKERQTHGERGTDRQTRKKREMRRYTHTLVKAL